MFQNNRDKSIMIMAVLSYNKYIVLVKMNVNSKNRGQGWYLL